MPHLASSALLTLLIAAPHAAPGHAFQEQRPAVGEATADEASEARAALTRALRLAPAYTGEHRYALTPPQREDVVESVALFEQVLGGDPPLPSAELALAWLNLETALVLLAEDDATRERPLAAAAQRERALAACDAALVLEPENFHGHYARGVVLTELGRAEAASAALESALKLCATRMGTEEDADLAAATIRYHALPYLIRAETERGRVEQALQACDAFAAEFSNEPWRLWDRGLRRSDVLLESGLFERAESELAELLAHEQHGELYGGYPQLHERLGYLAPLVGAPERTERLLRDAQARLGDLSDPGAQGILVYTWIYRLAFATEPDTEARAERKLRYLSENGPVPAAFDSAILNYLIDSEPDATATFRAAVAAERARRLEAGEPQGQLPTEAAYFEGLHAERAGDRQQAHAAYARSVAQQARGFSWEAAYAAHALGRLEGELAD